ncbi:claspin [Anopheles marshallii]|uniref:claspin n=1 Tax=Anopheles marshallii TaxID=1521116 RepID=UPI00237B5834|nr:claspin [Anopheles marshallii]
MDSDSELHATDTLRCDSDSEEDNQLNESASLSEHIHGEESVNHDTEVVQHLREDTVVTEAREDPSEEQDLQSSCLNIRKSKYTNIIDSESEGDEIATEVKSKEVTTNVNEAHLNRLKSLLDSDSDEQKESETKKKAKKQIKRKPKASSNETETLSESDNEGSGDAKSPLKDKFKRKHKKGTKAVESSNEVRSARDILASLNLFFDDDEDEVPVETNSGLIEAGSASSEDDTNEGFERTRTPVRKMTNKQAMEDRQIIQSESQRMAREKYIDVPYHRTKVFSFEEFRARKTICKPDPLRDCTGSSVSSNTSIRMTTEQLEAFARKLQERELESQNFFKSESESSGTDPEIDDATEKKPESQQDNVTAELHAANAPKGVEHSHGDACTVESVDDQSSSGNIPPGTDTVNTPSEKQTDHNEETSTAISEEQMDAMDDIVNRTSDNMEQMLASFATDETVKQLSASENGHVEVDYDAFLPNAPNTAISAKKAALLANMKLSPCPKLSGSTDMLIDLDSGTIQPKEPSGVDILFQRLAKCSANVRNPSPSATKTISILSTENGCVMLDTVPLFAKEERTLVHKEPVPGAAFLKLKQVLKEKIDNNRRDMIRKREAEFAKKMELDKAERGDGTDEEDEELLEDEQEDLADSDAETMSNAAKQQNQLLDDQALDEEMSDAEGSGSDNSEDEEEEDEDDEEEQGIGETGKKTGRIIKAFEDSDDDIQPTNDEDQYIDIEKQTQPPSSDDHNVITGMSNNSEQNEENLSKLWKDDVDRSNQREDDEEDDLLALCSGQFASQLSTQNHPPILHDACPTGVDLSQANVEPLYTQNQEPFRESQLMDLCSGRFETQAEQEVIQPIKDTENLPTNRYEQQDSVLDASDVCVGGRLRLDSSDDESEHPKTGPTAKGNHKRTTKHKRKHLNISDDEDERADEQTKPADDDRVEADEQQSDEDDDLEEEGERYVDYDSEENEVEVRLTKKEKELITARFVENEAELSESEWGSADEDEKGLDRYDVEMGDEEQYDQQQLQEELEKIHNRRMLDQDDRELEHLKEIFLEDEENAGVGRVRQFRWKNVEKTFSLDYDKTAAQDEDPEANGSDEDTELNWRKMRHERNLLLKDKNIDINSVDLTATTLLNPADATGITDEQENLQAGSTPCGKKKITIVRKSNNPSTMAVKEDNPFLISNSTILQGHKASFLSRDEETLKKLARLIPETEGSTSTMLTAKARNFVFATLSPAVEKSSKRSLDSEDVEVNANTKKKKTSGTEIGSKKKLLNSLL